MGPMTALLLRPVLSPGAHPADHPDATPADHPDNTPVDATATDAVAALLPADRERQAAMDAAGRAVADSGRVPVLPAGGGAAATAAVPERITADELLTRIGPEAARYALIRQARRPASPIDVQLWRRRTPDNPLFGVQFVQCRLAALGRDALDRAHAAGIVAEQPAEPRPGRDDATDRLRRALAGYRPAVLQAGARRQPHRLTSYLERLAVVASDYLTAAGWQPEVGQHPAADARLVLADGLTVLGISAPERM